MSVGNKAPWQRLLSLLLCAAMILSFVPTAWATEAENTVQTDVSAQLLSEEQLEAQASGSVFTILAASDFQERGDTYAQANANGAANVTAIVNQVTKNHSVDAVLFGGDYSLTMENAAASTDGYNALLGAFNGAGLGNADKVFIQGNHEPAGLSFITPTGGYDMGAYALYVLNEDDYNYGTQNQAAVQAQAEALESWLAEQTVGEKPIFVLSHVPLHYSMRTRNGGDAQYAKYLVDVLNGAGQRGLNIIFLFGHNHSGGYDSYLGGSTTFIGHGGTLWICDPAGTALAPKANTINFAYMNTGYVGYYEGIAGSDATRTMSVFEINGDDVSIRRYDANGAHGLKPCPGVWANSAESGYGYTLDTRTYADGTVVSGSDVEVTIPEILASNRLGEGNAAAVSIAAEAGASYTWVSDDTSVATVIGGSNGSATICAVSAGTAKISVYQDGIVKPVASFYIMVSGEVEVDSAGVFYKLVNSLTPGNNYIFADSNKEGPATILMAEGTGTGLTMTNVTINVYNSGIPHIRQPEDLNHKRWTFQNVNSEGYGQLKAHERTSMLGFRGLSNSGEVHWVKGEVLKVSNNPDTLLWTYNAQEGLRSNAVDYAGWNAKLTHFVHDGWGENYWAAVGRHLDPVYFSRVYAYEETALTAVAELSNKTGWVAVGSDSSTETGTMIVKTWSNGQVEYIPVTVGMLSGADTSAAGTCSNISVIYNDVLLTSSYTLTVGGSAGSDVEGTDYYYRLTDGFEMSDTFNEEHKYLILNRNTAGSGKLMMAQGYDGRHVVSVDVEVTLDADGVPCVMPEALSGDVVMQEWWYHQHYDMQWYLWQPNWNGGPNNYLRIAAVGGGNVVTGDLDIHALKAPVIAASSSLERYTTVRGALPVANNATIYLQYRAADDQFVGVLGSDRVQGDEVYVYERISVPASGQAVSVAGVDADSDVEPQGNSDQSVSVLADTGAAAASAGAGYYYRLTDSFRQGTGFNEEKQYLILNRNTEGTGQMMVADGYSDRGVLTQDVTVRLDVDGVPCVLPGDLTGNTVFQEWWYHNHSDSEWYLWQPNWDGGSNNYLRIAGAGGGDLVTGGSSDDYTLRNAGYDRSIYGDFAAGNGTFHIQYNQDLQRFVGLPGATPDSGSFVYIYEKVAYDEEVVIDNGKVFYKLADTFTNGKKYILASRNDMGKAYIVKAFGENPPLDYGEAIVGAYRKGMPFIYVSDDEAMSSDAIRDVWIFKDNTLKIDSRSELLSVDQSQPFGTAFGMQLATTGNNTQNWTIDGSGGVRSQLTDSSGNNYRMTFYLNDGDNDFNRSWRVAGEGSYDPNYYFQVYAYEETPLTATVTMSDKTGVLPEGAAGTAETGSMLVLTWSNGRVEYVPVTASMLDVGTGTAGTYTAKVTYGDVVVCRDYVLTVGDSKTIPASGYYYRLTDTIVEGGTYLFVTENTKTYAHMLQSTGDGATVAPDGVTVGLDANGIPCVLARDVKNELIQTWPYTTKSNTLCFKQQNAWTALNSNYLNVSGYDSAALVTGNYDAAKTLINFEMHTERTVPKLGVFPAVRGYASGVAMYLTYHDDNFYATRDSDRIPGQEVYAYEKVNYNTAEISALGIIGSVGYGSGADAKTGTYVQITYPDGTVENIPVTLTMLGLGAADVAGPGTLSGLTLTYEGVVLTANYTLKVRDFNTDPVYPEPGSVKVDKQKDTTEYKYEETGVARVDLSTSGVPMSKPVDVLLIVDTSASVEMYTMNNGETRIEAMRKAVDALVDELAQPNADGSLPDISLAISEFNQYTYFAAGNTFEGTDNTGAAHQAYKATESSRQNGLVQDFTSIYEMQNFNPAKLVNHSGTNYDVAFQDAYEIISARKEYLLNNGLPEREQVVIFMTDGICYQYNYMSYNGTTLQSPAWRMWLEGTFETEEEKNQWLPALASVHFYNDDENKHWMAEAIKGSPDQTYKVIWRPEDSVAGYYSDANNLLQVPGLGATIYSIGFGVYVDGEESVRISDHILGNIASSPYNYFKAEETEDLMEAFADIGHGVRKAATNAEFYDQMGEEFSLRMKAVTNSKGEAIAKRPTIQVKSYDVYKYGEIGTTVNGVFVTHDMVGRRKSNIPVILETVTFNDEGTEAYSSRKGENVNILENGIINAYYFMYNTTEYDPEEVSFAIPGPETFLWNIGDITERELVLSYYVYLEDSMGENGGHTAGGYDTNNYANLNYVNYKNENVIQSVDSPNLEWEPAEVNYGFYLVNENGEIIQQDGSVTDFANKVVVGKLSEDQVINLNTDTVVTPRTITLADGTVIEATLTIPEGYELFVQDPSATIHTNSGNNTGGSWDVDDSETTYVDNGSNPVNSDGTTKSGEYDDTTIWFAVVYTGMGTPVTNKTVEATDDPNEFVLTLDAYAAGKVSSVTVTKPTDIVLVLDHSASMYTPAGAPGVLYSPAGDYAGAIYDGPGRIEKSELDSTKGKHMGYYIAQSTSTKWWILLRYDEAANLWYGYSIPSTECYVNPEGGASQHTQTQSWTFDKLPSQLVYYKTQYAMLHDTIPHFINKLKASAVDHRVAIVGFSGPETLGSRLYVGGDEAAYNSYRDLYNANITEERRTELYQKALKDLHDESEYEELLAAVEAIETNYSWTCPSVGLKMASELFAANPVHLAERDRIVVLFTDGLPNKVIANTGYGVSDEADVRNEIVRVAATAKQQGASIYAISTTTLSEGQDRTFLSYMSSDYPDAVDYYNPGQQIAAPMYTQRVETLDDFDVVFNNVAHSTVHPNVKLDKDAVLREVLTDYFVLNPDDQVDVGVYTAAYNGDGTYANLEPVTLASEKGQGYYVELLSSDGIRKDIIEVSGFDYANEYISSVPRIVNGENYYGSKLVVEVRIRTRNGFWGGNNVPTNEPTTGIYDKNRVYVEEFPEPQVNVPIYVDVTAQDKTIYYGDTIDANQDGWEGDELLQQITVGTQTGSDGKIVNGSTVTVNTVNNGDGTITTTFVPEASWMDDYATMNWVDGSTKIESDLSNTHPDDYTYKVEVKPNTDGLRNNGENPGTTSNIAGNIDGGPVDPEHLAVPPAGATDSDTGHVFVKVPVLTFKDSVTEFGTATNGYDYTSKDYVSTTWTFMTDSKDTSKAPAPSTNAPELTLTFTPENGATQFVGDTKVDVDVSRADGLGKDIQSVTTYQWDECVHVEHGSCGEISSHKGNASSHEFWVHTLFAMPDTVVIDYGLPVDIDVLTNDLSVGKYGKLKYVGAASEFTPGNEELWKYLQGYSVSGTPKFDTTSQNGTYGKLEVLVDESNATYGKVRYTLNRTNGMQMDREETFVYAVDYSGSVGTTGYYYSTVTVIPATIIYYEDSFVSYTTYNAANDAQIENKWTYVSGRNDTAIQDTDRPGAEQLYDDANNIYGYDSEYPNDGAYSLNSYHQITVDGTTYGKATFTFTGTAFDVIALSSNTTGSLAVSVHSGTDTPSRANRLCTYLVDTYYGYKPQLSEVIYTYKQNGAGDKYWEKEVVKEAAEGTVRNPAVLPANPQVGDQVSGIEYVWVITDSNDPNALYQVPVMKVDMAKHDTTGNGYGTYTVVISVAYDDMFYHEQYGTDRKYDFMLDAIRIYDQANDGEGNTVIEEAYKADGEGWPTYTELRNILIGQNSFDSLGKNDEVGGVVFIDGIPELNNDSATDEESDVSDNVTGKSVAIRDYANFGPNNELYLAPGQAVAFKLTNVTNVQNVHLALKSVGGTAKIKVYGVASNGTKTYALGTANESKSIATATDLYYDITSLKNLNAIIIYNCGGTNDKILSVTNLKMTHANAPETAGTAQVAVDQSVGELAVSSLRPNPEKPVNPFADVKGGKYYYEGVLWAVSKGITEGMTPTTFAPDETCTRGQVVTFLWRAAGSPEPVSTKHSFEDVKQGSYYYKAVLWAVENGITNGIDETHFGPKDPCSRGHVVTFLWRAKGCPEAESAEHPFTDVKEGKFYYEAMLWARENGITSGMTQSTFGPGMTCTRGQVVTFLYRAYRG